MKILIVEDNADAAMAVELILQSIGHQTQVAQSIGAARAVLESGDVALLLTDLTLPDGAGQTLTDEHPGLPAIAMSGHPRSTHWERCQQAGFVDYLEKPISLAVLVGSVRSVLGE